MNKRLLVLICMFVMLLPALALADDSGGAIIKDEMYPPLSNVSITIDGAYKLTLTDFRLSCGHKPAHGKNGESSYYEISSAYIESNTTPSHYTVRIQFEIGCWCEKWITTTGDGWGFEFTDTNCESCLDDYSSYVRNQVSDYGYYAGFTLTKLKKEHKNIITTPIAFKGNCVQAANTAGQKCAFCGDVVTEPIYDDSMVGKHSFVNWVPAPEKGDGWHKSTCETCQTEVQYEGGTYKLGDCVTPMKCGTCGNTLGGATPSIHKGPYDTRDVAPTCQTFGAKGETYCTACGKTTKTGTEVPKAAHEYGQWTYAPENGVDMHAHTCKNCPDTQTEACVKSKATCITLAQCDSCKQTFGEYDLTNHVGDTYIRDAWPATCQAEGYTGNVVCSSCNNVISRGTRIAKTAHVYGNWTYSPRSGTDMHICVCIYCPNTQTRACRMTPATCISAAKCADCGHTSGKVDLTNHVGQTYLANSYPATCQKVGNTGNTYCSSCDTLIELGDEIPITNEHEYGQWTYAPQNGVDMHSHKCVNCTDTQTEACVKSKATCITPAQCTMCKQTFGAVDLNNHVGNTEIRDIAAATCQKAGNKGNTYCASCDTLLMRGEETPKLAHEYGQWTYAPENGVDMHAHTCINCADTQTEACEKSKANCVSPAQCGLCKQTFGGIDQSNHTGKTAIVDAIEATCQMEGSTGDVICASCDVLIERGQVIPKTTHVYGD